MTTIALPDVEELVEDVFDDLFEVLVLDDDRTTFDAVIAALVAVCGHSHEAAGRLAWRVHTEGSAVVAADSLTRAEEMVAALSSRGLRAALRPV